jgi:acetyl/propionyl-CoA carboxylase alpha subunit
VIPPYYDSLVAKLIAYGSDRAEAIARMKRALDMFVVEGIHTSIPLHQRILADPDFQAGRFDTNFIKKAPAAEGRRRYNRSPTCKTSIFGKNLTVFFRKQRSYPLFLVGFFPKPA